MIFKKLLFRFRKRFQVSKDLSLFRCYCTWQQSITKYLSRQH